MQRTLGFISGAIVASAMLAGCGKTYPVTAAAPTAPPLKPHVTSVYVLPTPPASAGPEGLSSAPSDSNCATGVIWFAEESANQIGALNESATFYTYTLPNSNSEPYGITCGPDGQVWFTEFSGNRIGRYDPSTQNFAEFTIPTASAEPMAIVLGQDGGLWFTEYASGKIGRADATSGTISEFSTGGTHPLDAIDDTSGNIWFTLNGSNQVGSISTSTDAVTLYNVPTAGSQPYAVLYGADSAIWFTENATGKIGRIVPSNGSITDTALANCANPGSFAQGTDGDFYIICQGATPTILQYNPLTGSQKTYSVRSGSDPQWAIIAFDNKLYFTDSGLNSIDQFTY